MYWACPFQDQPKTGRVFISIRTLCDIHPPNFCEAAGVCHVLTRFSHSELLLSSSLLSFSWTLRRHQKTSLHSVTVTAKTFTSKQVFKGTSQQLLVIKNTSDHLSCSHDPLQFTLKGASQSFLFNTKLQFYCVRWIEGQQWSTGSPLGCLPACRDGRIKLLYLSGLLSDPALVKGQSQLSQRQNTTRLDHDVAIICCCWSSQSSWKLPAALSFYLQTTDEPIL